MATYIELHVEDFNQVKKFYELLEFEVVWMREAELKKGYLVMRNEKNILMFWCGNEFVYNQSFFSKYPKETPRGVGVEVVLMFDNITSYYERVRKLIDINQPLEKKPWGVLDFRVIDPSGFYLRFSETYNVEDIKYAIQ